MKQEQKRKYSGPYFQNVKYDPMLQKRKDTEE